MKKYFSLLLGVICFCTNVFASDVCVRTLATVNCGRGTLENLQEGGFVNVNGTTVLNLAQIDGIYSIQNAELKDVVLNGVGSLVNTAIKGNFSAKGTLNISNMQFPGQFAFSGAMTAQASNFLIPIELTVEKASFNHVTTKSILVHKTEHPNERLNLSDGTIVNGDITFESNNGLVILGAGAQITGRVIGGKILHS